MVFLRRKLRWFRGRTGIVGVLAVGGLLASGLPAAAVPAQAWTSDKDELRAAAVPNLDPVKIDVTSPRFVEPSADSSRLFAASEKGDFTVINVPTDQVSATLKVGNVSSMVVSPDGLRVFLATSQQQNYGVTLVTVPWKEPTVIPMEGPVRGLAVSPDGSSVYAAVSGSPLGSIAVIDVATARIRMTIPVGHDPSQILVAPAGDKIYILSATDRSVTVIATSTGTVGSKIPLGGAPMEGVISPDGSHLYYPKGDGGIAVVSALKSAVIGEIPTRAVATAPIFTPDGSRAFTVDQTGDEYSLAEIDLQRNSLTTVDLQPLGPPTMNLGAFTVRLSHDGSRLFVVSTYIMVVNVPTLVVARHISPQGDYLQGLLTVLPNGEKGYVAPADQGNYLWVIPTPRSANIWKDYNSDGRTDVLARDTAGELWLYPGNGRGDWLPRSRVGTGWNTMNLIMTPGDFNGDGSSDVLARDQAGDLWLYPGNGRSDWLPRSKVGGGWNVMTAVVTPGDFNGDGHGDVLARDAQGDVWLYPGTGRGALLPRTKVGTGWNDMTAILGPGDTHQQGRDVVARDKWGTLWLYQGDNSGGWVPFRLLVGLEWNVMTAMATPGDFDGDDLPDILARDSAGVLWLYPGTLYGGYQPRQRAGVGWNVMTALV